MRNQLLCGVIAACLYFATAIIASLTWPGYSHVTQYVSELGSAAAPYPMLFNGGILLAGVFGLLGAIGIFRYFQQQQRSVAGGFAAAAMGAWSIGLLFGGAFPMPNPLHNAFGIILGVVLLPPALLVGLRGRGSTSLYVYLAGWMLAMYALLLILFGVGGLVTTGNLGLWQRGFALVLIGGIGIACGLLWARAARPGAS